MTDGSKTPPPGLPHFVEEVISAPSPLVGRVGWGACGRRSNQHHQPRATVSQPQHARCQPGPRLPAQLAAEIVMRFGGEQKQAAVFRLFQHMRLRQRGAFAAVGFHGGGGLLAQLLELGHAQLAVRIGVEAAALLRVGFPRGDALSHFLVGRGLQRRKAGKPAQGIERLARQDEMLGVTMVAVARHQHLARAGNELRGGARPGVARAGAHLGALGIDDAAACVVIEPELGRALALLLHRPTIFVVVVAFFDFVAIPAARRAGDGRKQRRVGRQRPADQLHIALRRRTDARRGHVLHHPAAALQAEKLHQPNRAQSQRHEQHLRRRAAGRQAAQHRTATRSTA